MSPRQAKRGRPRALTLLWRGVCLRCPRCGARSLFRTWFAMHERCAVCGLRFEREQGYFLGAIYINYGVTVVLALLGSFAPQDWTEPSPTSTALHGSWHGIPGPVFPIFPWAVVRLRSYFRSGRGSSVGAEEKLGRRVYQGEQCALTPFAPFWVTYSF